MGERISTRISSQITDKRLLSLSILNNTFFSSFSLRSIEINVNEIGMEQQKVWKEKEQRDYSKDQLQKLV
jgi:hypothetical protein